MYPWLRSGWRTRQALMQDCGQDNKTREGHRSGIFLGQEGDVWTWPQSLKWLSQPDSFFWKSSLCSPLRRNIINLKRETELLFLRTRQWGRGGNFYRIKVELLKIIIIPVAILTGSSQAGFPSVREVGEGDSCIVGDRLIWTETKTYLVPGQVTNWLLFFCHIVPSVK